MKGTNFSNDGRGAQRGTWRGEYKPIEQHRDVAPVVARDVCALSAFDAEEMLAGRYQPLCREHGHVSMLEADNLTSEAFYGTCAARWLGEKVIGLAPDSKPKRVRAFDNREARFRRSYDQLVWK